MNKKKELLKKSLLELIKECGSEGVFAGEDHGIIVVYAEKHDDTFKHTAIADGNGYLVSNALIEVMSNNPSCKAVVYEATKHMAQHEMNLVKEQERVSRLSKKEIN